jgi:hypothetical protein
MHARTIVAGVGRQVPSGAARGADPGQDERPVPGQVVQAGGVQLRPDGAGVSAARRASRREWRARGVLVTVKNLDYPGCLLPA